MQEEKFISEFWKSNERSNFSKEATVLFFYLIYIWKNENKPEKFYVHPARLNYISFTAPEKDWCSGEYSLCMERAGQGKEITANGK